MNGLHFYRYQSDICTTQAHYEVVVNNMLTLTSMCIKENEHNIFGVFELCCHVGTDTFINKSVSHV